VSGGGAAGPRPGGRRLAAKLLLALLPAAAILAAAEAAFRAREGGEWWVEIEAAQLAGGGIDYEENADHLRDRDYESPRPAGRVRVLILGDSFTYGWGVRSGADVFPELLETRLNADKPDPRVEAYEILNGGVPAHPASSWATFAEAAERRFEPDLVLAVFFLRDGTSIRFSEDFFAPIRARMKAWRESDPLARGSAAWRWWRGRRLALEMSRDYVDRFRRAYLGAPEETEEWARAQKALVRIRDFFAQRSVPLERFAQRASIPCFSLLPALEREDPAALWVSPSDQHPNERCHRLVADALEPRLRASLARVVPR
jgi:hypothetical protein